MALQFSKNRIETFVGHVFPLALCDGAAENVIFFCDNEQVVTLHAFSEHKSGVLLTSMRAGNAKIFAECEGESTCCEITVREKKAFSPLDDLQFFVGDFHDHTSKIHNHNDFAARESGFVSDYLNELVKDGRLDFAVVSDHAVTTNDKDFFLGFTGAQEMPADSTEVFAGAECEITVVEEDRYGIPYKNAGEIVTVNAARYASVRTWKEFLDAMEECPHAVCVLAHPFISGFSVKGNWNFSLHKNNGPVFRHVTRGVEMGDGGIRSANALHEYMYSIALDNGFKVSVTCASDSHGPDWGYDRFLGKTVILAPEKSREAFLTALRENRFYATESGNLKLRYRVNGVSEAGTVPLCDTYRFHINLSYFKEDPTTRPTVLRVISDYGKTVAELKDVDFSDLTFDIHSTTARYFYLRFTDEQGRRTWSAPVWTSREIDPPAAPLTPIPKKGFTVTELESGRDASVLVNDNPSVTFESDLGAATYLIDMQKEYEVSALGHYTPFTTHKDLIAKGLVSPKILAALGREKVPELPTALSRFASAYEIWLSVDGESFEKCDEGRVRCFSGEDVLRFPTKKARYIKFKVLSTTGAEWRTAFDDLTLHIAELSVFA